MSVLYRALWSDEALTNNREVLSLARKCFCTWATHDHEWDTLPEGDTVIGARRVTLRTVDGDGTHGLEGVSIEAPPGNGDSETVWTTTMRVAASADRVYSWVELSMETDDLTQRVKVGRPRLVDELLRLPGQHMLGASLVYTDVLDVPVDGVPILISQLRNPKRSLPMLVFSEPGDPDDGRWLRIAERTARRAGGVATVVTLRNPAATAFRSSLGQLSVWGGAERTYVPAPLESEADGWRHRYIPAHRMQAADIATVDRLVYAVTQLSTQRRPPTVFALFDGSVDGRSAQLVSDINELGFELELEREERGQVERTLAKANGHLRRLEKELDERGLAELFWETHDTPAEQDEPDEPDEVQDVTDAVLTAQLTLTDWVVLPDSAPRELDGIDSGPNAYAWGNTTWRGLRALAAYARAKAAGATGDFWAWCERGEPHAWPATPKKLSMRESETVENNAGLRRARIFPVVEDVDATGSIYMGAHLKISEGGGDLAPRVYFHDDTGGTTGKVHVGFVGPHHLVPNTRS